MAKNCRECGYIALETTDEPCCSCTVSNNEHENFVPFSTLSLSELKDVESKLVKNIAEYDDGSGMWLTVDLYKKGLENVRKAIKDKEA